MDKLRKGMSLKKSEVRIVHCGQEGFFRCRFPHFLVRKQRFFEVNGVSARTRRLGVEPVQTYCGQGGGVSFSRFCADVLYGRHL